MIPEGQSWFLTKGRRGLEQKVAKETKVWVSRFERACGGGVGAKTPSGGVVSAFLCVGAVFF